MATRTRTHCPNCQTQYEPRARKCAVCGRTRDQLSDAELAAQSAPPVRSVPTSAAAGAGVDQFQATLWVGWAVAIIAIFFMAPIALVIGAIVWAGMRYGFPAAKRRLTISTLLALAMAWVISTNSHKSAPAVSTPPVVIERVATPDPKAVAEQVEHERAMQAKADKELAEARAYSEQQAEAARVNGLIEQRQQQWQQGAQPQQQPQREYAGFAPTGEHVGRRGGVYHYSSSGKKVYKKR